MWSATHRVPPQGMDARPLNDPNGPVIPLSPDLDVQVVQNEGPWTRILCSNGWEGWVDGHLLVERPPAAAQPTGPKVDSAELEDALRGALDQYEALLTGFQEGRIEADEFRRQAFRAGLVVHGDEAWMLDLDHGSWVRYDGLELTVLHELAGGG